MKTFLTIISFALLFPNIVCAQSWEWNSGGTIDCVPTLGGTWDGWGEWFITTVYNDTGMYISVEQFGFPCSYGDGTGPYEDIWWAAWLDVGGIHFVPEHPFNPDESGTFDPVDDADTNPPTIYSYVDLDYYEDFVVNSGTYFCFGYKNPGLGGQVGFNDVITRSWHNNRWISDEKPGRTAILQFRGYHMTGIESATLGTIKAAFK